MNRCSVHAHNVPPRRVCLQPRTQWLIWRTRTRKATDAIKRAAGGPAPYLGVAHESAEAHAADMFHRPFGRSDVIINHADVKLSKLGISAVSADPKYNLELDAIYIIMLTNKDWR